MLFKFAFFLNSAQPEPFVFGLDKQTLINAGIHLVNAIVLFLALGFILYKPVQDFMKKRTNKIQNQLNEAKEKSIQAEALKKEYEKKLSEIDLERLAIIEKAKADAGETAKHIIDEAKNEADRLKKRADINIQNEKDRLKKETRLHIIELSSLMAAKFIELKIDENMQNKVFDDALAQLEEAQWQT